jgi:hypothetical protein
MKKVKILKHIGHWVPDQVVEVEDKVADDLCYVNHMDDGRVIQRAILLEDFEAIQDVPISECFVGDGKKNVVDSKPYEPGKGFVEKEVVEKKEVEKKETVAPKQAKR